MEEIQKTASARMDRFLKLPTVQKVTYGFVLDAHSSFHRRQRMVQSFLWLQSKRDQFPNKTQRQLASITANSLNRGGHTVRMIFQWTNIWMQGENLPNTHAGQHKHKFSCMDDEDVTFAVREFSHQQGESECFNPPLFLSLVLTNITIELNSYNLAQFVNEFLERTHNQSGSQTVMEIEETIECIDIQDAEHPDECQKKEGIRCRTARRWLKKLGYSWREVKKWVFFLWSRAKRCGSRSNQVCRTDEER